MGASSITALLCSCSGSTGGESTTDTVELCAAAARTLRYEEFRIFATMTGAIPDGASEFGTLCTIEMDGGRFVYVFLPQNGGPPREIDNAATP